MKTIKLIAVISMALCVSFTSCSKDDENGETPKTEVSNKRILEVVIDNRLWGLKDNVKFEYLNYKISKITTTRTGESKPYILEFQHNGTKLKERVTNSFDGEPTYTNSYTLDSNGYIVSYKYQSDGIFDTYTYSNGYLTSIKIGDGDPKGFTKHYNYDKNWNLIASYDFDKIISSNTPNIGGLFIAYGDYYQFKGIHYAGLLGQASKNLPKEAIFYESNEKATYYYRFSYELDSDGFVKKMSGKITTKEDGSSKEDYFGEWTESYTYEVI